MTDVTRVENSHSSTFNFQSISNITICESSQDEFLKGLRISPDGRSILTHSESNFVGIWTLPKDFMSDPKIRDDSSDELLENGSVSRRFDGVVSLMMAICTGDSTYDIAWYPYMSSEDSVTNCFISTARDHPIHLWDANYGAIRATYRGYNHLDELDAAHTISFNCHGDKIYAGGNRILRCFDLAIPGRQCTNMPTKSCKNDHNGQGGIISCISFCPDYSGLYAAGSYDKSVSFYAENTSSKNPSLLEFNDLPFGVTHLRWSPCGNMLWVGGRRHSDIRCFDVRSTRSMLGKKSLHYTSPLKNDSLVNNRDESIQRTLHSNQRLSFDLDPSGKYLATGSQENEILIFNTQTFELIRTHTEDISDCVNGVAFHPHSHILASTSGQRHFSDVFSDTDTDSESGSPSGTSHGSWIRRRRPPLSALQLWSVD